MCEFRISIYVFLFSSQDLDAMTMSKIANCLEVDSFSQNEYIIREGTIGSTFYIISKGEVIVTQSVTNAVVPMVS